MRVGPDRLYLAPEYQEYWHQNMVFKTEFEESLQFFFVPEMVKTLHSVQNYTLQIWQAVFPSKKYLQAC